MQLVTDKVNKVSDIFLWFFLIFSYLLGFLPDVGVDLSGAELFNQQLVMLL